MAAETVELHVSDSSRVQFTATSSGLIVTVLSPGPWTADGKPRMVIRGSTTLTQPALLALKKLLEKGRS